MTYQFSYYAQRNFVLLNKIFVTLSSTKYLKKIKLYRCFMSNRIPLVPCGSFLFSTLAHCALDIKYGDKQRIKILEPKALSHEYLIRQACNLNVDAATQLLTLTVAALLDLNKDYRESLQELISLTEESLQTMSMSAYQEKLWDQIIETRSQMEDLKKSLLELTGFMDYVEKVATSAAEASYLGGADYSSTAMCERINSAQQQLQIEQQKTKQIEDELLLTQESYVKKATSFRKKGNDDSVEKKGDHDKVEKKGDDDRVGKKGDDDSVEKKIRSPTLSQIIDGLRLNDKGNQKDEQ